MVNDVVGKANARLKILKAGKWGKVRRTLHELAHGKTAYLPDEKKSESKPKIKTKRTSKVESQLKSAGLSDSDIAKLKGKK